MTTTETDYVAWVAELTDQNQHWEAALVIAARFATTPERRTLDELWQHQKSRGYSLPHEITRRSEITNAVLERLPADQADALREAL